MVFVVHLFVFEVTKWQWQFTVMFSICQYWHYIDLAVLGIVLYSFWHSVGYLGPSRNHHASSSLIICHFLTIVFFFNICRPLRILSIYLYHGHSNDLLLFRIHLTTSWIIRFCALHTLSLECYCKISWKLHNIKIKVFYYTLFLIIWELVKFHQISVFQIPYLYFLL